MRLTSCALILSCGLHCAAQRPIPDRIWIALLQGCIGDCNVTQSNVTRRDAVAISEFVKQQVARNSQFWESVPHGEKVCSPDVQVDWNNPPTLDCLGITALHVGILNVFYVSPQRGYNNPDAWIVRVSNGGAVDLVGGLVGGTPDVLPQMHHGAHDLVLVVGMGVSYVSLQYLAFDGHHYRRIETHQFETCNELPGHELNDTHWCFKDGRRAGENLSIVR